MAATPRDIAEALKSAVQTERDGYHFYMMAASSTEDAQGKQVFQTLAREEQEHARYLAAHYKALTETGKPDPSVRLGARAELSPENPIFSPALRARAAQAHYEMTALSVGMQLEQASVAFYRDLAAKAQDPGLVAFLEELASWEEGHLEALRRQHELLRDDYYADGGFARF